MFSATLPFTERPVTIIPIENQKRICAHEVLPIEVAAFNFMKKPIEVTGTEIAFSNTGIGKEIIAWHLMIREKMFGAI